jgi:hypothetical protein
VATAVGLLAACETPRPFAEDKPPAGLLNFRDSVGVSVAPIEGEPKTTAAKLGAAVAKALQQLDVPASARSTGPASNMLYGRIEQTPSGKDKSTVLAVWRLRDASGNLIGQRSERLEASNGEWNAGKDETVTRLAVASANSIAGLLQDEPPKQATNIAPDGRTRVAVRKVSGAPGDGDQSLARAVTAVLQRQDVSIVDDPKGKTDLYLDGEVTLTPVPPNKQHVKIVWRVRRSDGTEIGTVGQENDVPKGMLEGPWGDLAYSIALAAGNGIIELVSRGAPAPQGAS